MTSQKTYKRETAGALLFTVMAMGIATAWFPAMLPAFEALAPMTFFFAAGAFGMDSYAKQIKGE